MATKDVTVEKGFLLTNDDQGGFSTGLTNPATYDECSKFSNPGLLFFQQAGYGRLSMNQILPGGSYRFGNGTVSAPAVSWAADTDTGRYLIAAGNPAESVNSTLVYDWNTSRFKSAVQVQLITGSAGTPSLTFSADTDNDLGLYRVGEDNMGFTADGTLQWDFNTTRLYSSSQVIYMGVDAQIYPTSYISIDKTINGNALITLRNQSAGGNANCGLYLLNDALTSGVQFGLTGTGWSPFGNFQAQEAFIACDSGVSMLINVPSGEQFRLATGNVVHWTMNADGNLTWTQTLGTSGSPVMMTMTGGAHLQLAADTEASDIVFGFNRSVEFTTGAGTFSDQRVVKFLAPTYTATAATETITRAATVYIDRAPQAGTNLNITSAYALWVDDGAVRIDGALTAGSVTLSGFTQGSVLFAGASGIVAEDNANLFFDDTAKYLGVGINASLAARLHISDSHATTTPLVILNQASTGDTGVLWSLATTASYIAGIDNSDSDSWKLSYAASGTAVLGTNDRISVTTGGLVGVNVLSSAPRLHVRESEVSGTSYNSDDVCTIEKNGACAINIIGSTTGTCGVFFSDTARARGFLRYSHVTDALTFRTGGSDNMTLSSAGLLAANLCIRSGTATDGGATGDFTSGILNESRLFWDQSTSLLDLIQTSTGDPASRWAVGTTASFIAGIDNSDSDSWKISYAASGSAVLGTGDYLTVSTGGNIVCGNAALATNATDGFLYLPTCAGAPSGTPTGYTGRAPFILDTTNDRLYFYYDDGGGAGWHYIARTA